MNVAGRMGSMTPQPILPKSISNRKNEGTPSPMRVTNTAQTYQNSKIGSPSKLPQPHQGQKKYRPHINLNSGAMTERTKPVQNF